MWIIYLILCIASGIFWRMGGAAGYDKLYRRIGSSICIFMPLVLCHNPLMYSHLIALGMVMYGSWSYFGWFTPGDKKERWFNFLAAALLSQCSYLVLFFTWPALAVAIGMALAGALGKVAIDKSSLPGQDVISELYYGFMMCAGISLNCFLS